jgi:hypothetical protein
VAERPEQRALLRRRRDRALDDRRLVARGAPHQRLQPARARRAVVVDERDERGARRAPARVARRGGPAPLLVAQRARDRRLRPVVDHDHLEARGGERLGAQRGEQGRQPRGPVLRRDDDADLWLHARAGYGACRSRTRTSSTGGGAAISCQPRGTSS